MGDSRALLSSESGAYIEQLTDDHKPMSIRESHRILKNGGRIYKAQSNLPVDMPYRVAPGKLTVSRIIGEIEAKLPEFGGNPRVVIADPDIYEVKLKKDDDFILLASNGIFSKVTNEEIVKYIFLNYDNKTSIYENSGKAIDSAIKLSAYKGANGNLSAILIAFSAFQPKKEEERIELFDSLPSKSPNTVRTGKDKTMLMKMLLSSPRAKVSS